MKLRVFTSFSGYDSQCLALDRVKKLFPNFDYELVGWSEIDKYAIKAHNALFPQWADRNFGNITEIDWNKVSDFDLFTYSSPCITEDSLILTKEGYKQIKDIKVGDIVWTRKNEWHPVVKKFDNGQAETYFLKAFGCENIHCTSNHKFLVRKRYYKWNNNIRQYDRLFAEPEFVEAKDLDKDCFLGVPIDTRAELPKWDGVENNQWGHHRIVNKLSALFENEQFWYLMGRYVGDGWKRSSNTGSGIVISCGGRNEAKLQSCISLCGFKPTIVHDRTANKYQISSKELFSFVDRYGYYAYGKRIDGETMALPKHLLKSFVEGCEDSDGYCKGSDWKISTTSRELAYGLVFCVNKVYERPCSIHKTIRPKQVVIEGRICNQRDSYEIKYSKTARKQDKVFVDNGYVWFPFRKLVKASVENVYNMEVEDDHSYILQGVISKNCQDFSMAGKMRGGQEGSGTRSSLLWYCRNAIIAKKPKYLLMENVKALVSKKFLPTFLKWERELASYGYSNFSQVLNAKDYGIPQNRERIFMVSILGDENFSFPEKEPLKLRLKDMLESNVDEKYYLSDETVQKYVDWSERQKANGNGFRFSPTDGGGMPKQ